MDPMVKVRFVATAYPGGAPEGIIDYSAKALFAVEMKLSKTYCNDHLMDAWSIRRYAAAPSQETQQLLRTTHCVVADVTLPSGGVEHVILTRPPPRK